MVIIALLKLCSLISYTVSPYIIPRVPLEETSYVPQDFSHYIARVLAENTARPYTYIYQRMHVYT